jgi:hypothetical protein
LARLPASGASRSRARVSAAAIATQAAGQPVISIDTKKKELIGPYKNGGSDYRPEGCPDKVNEHDFADKDLGKAVPYGVYDITANTGCVSVGIDNDTAQFSVNSIRRWLDVMGRERYPGMNQLMITADGGGSMVYINTLMLQQVLAQPEWSKKLTARDLRALTPLIWEHVNPYGRFELDMEARLLID